MQLQESAAEGSRQHLTPAILTCTQLESNHKNVVVVVVATTTERRQEKMYAVIAGAFVCRSMLALKPSCILLCGDIVPLTNHPHMEVAMLCDISCAVPRRKQSCPNA